LSFITCIHTFQALNLPACHRNCSIAGEDVDTLIELELWWTEEARSIFVYYLTGSLAIAFAATIIITKSLQRNEVTS